MDHFITNIYIENVRHLKNIDINLGENRTHLILTGKNGSGKTSLLEAIRNNLFTINRGEWNKLSGEFLQTVSMYENRLKSPTLNETDRLNTEQKLNHWAQRIEGAKGGLRLSFSKEDDLDACFQRGDLITAYFPAYRKTEITIPHGVEDIKLSNTYTVDQDPVRDLMKYLVHLKTQQAYAQNEKDTENEQRIEKWLSIFQTALQKLMDDDSIRLVYDYRNYKFEIHQDGRNPFDFTQLSDGYSAAIRIMADLMMRMDQNWLMNNTGLVLDTEGIVLIDEIETHLHLELQKSILPFMVEMFPRLQFIVTTHSPFVVNSLDNVVIYDLENHIMARNGLTNVTYSGVVEGYFRADELSAKLRNKFNRYRELVTKENLSDEEFAEIPGLEMYLEEIPDYLSLGIATEYRRLKLEFENRENHKE